MSILDNPGPNINSLIARGIMTFRQGQSLTPAMSDVGTGELYRARLQAVIKERLADKHYIQYVHIRDMARDAVSLIHAGRMDDAARKFKEAESELDAQRPELETRLLCQSWIAQGSAYMETRRRQWVIAYRRLQAAMAADEQLEEDFAYDIFHIGRVHIVHLMVRLLAAEGRYEEAITLAQNIAAYVLAQTDSLPLGGGWNTGRAGAVPEEFQSTMLVRVSGEVGTMMASAKADDAKHLFTLFPSWKGYAGHPVLSEIYDWGLAKQAYLSGNIENFLIHAADILVQGPRESSLWYSVALDFCRACAALRPKQTRNFLSDALDAARNWSDIPVAISPPQLRLAMEDLVPSPDSGSAQDRAVAYVPARPERQFQLYSVGLPRTGTSSLANLFANFRSANEFQEKATMEIVTAHRFARTTTRDFHCFLDRRDEEGHLEMDAASFNHFYLDYLVYRHPRAQFIFSVRDPYGWTNSYMKLLLRYKNFFGDTPPRWTDDYGQMIFKDFDWSTFQSIKTLSKDIEATVEKFIIHWADANRRIINLLPQDRSLIVDTDNLSKSLSQIASFANISLGELTDQHHVNISPDTQNLLDGLDPTWFADLCLKHGYDVIESTRVRVNEKAL